MLIQLKKIGTVLTSRQAGKEAFLAFSPYLINLLDSELVDVDFQGLITFSPAWGDEFLSPLLVKFGDRVKFHNLENPSVQATLELLDSIKRGK